MKSARLILPALLSLTAVTANAESLTPSHKENRCQKEMRERGYGMFIHFGMNTFIDKEWSEGVEPATTYNPTELDCDQWVRTARDAGFKYVLLVTKHHDGFCLWDSAVTDYDVASSGNTTDVVKAVADACRKYGLEFGVYYSLWDRHEPTYQEEDFSGYLKFMDAQLTELLTNYGDVCEIWFDGGWDKKPEAWNIPHIYELVKSLQPNCAMGVNNSAYLPATDLSANIYGSADPDHMTGEYDVQFGYFPMDFRLKDPYIANWRDNKIYNVDGEDYYLPFEHTICLSKQWNWFQKDHPMETRDVDELEELFYRTTANNNTLVVNVPPDERGLMRQNEINTLLELRDRIGLNPKDKKFRHKSLNTPISIGQPSRATSVYSDEYGPEKAFDGGLYRRWASTEPACQLEVDLPAGKTFDRISIFEYMDEVVAPDGFSRRRTNRITDYTIDACNNGEWETIYMSTEPMGDCKVINFAAPQRAERLRLNVRNATAPPSIYEFSVYSSEK
ncbi:MAG: crotonobetainyl-CoA--carnitine CoA-transferase [Barnesiella sp.]|nr:crotonobetainyl-CoA--carnitine CoA-transferase [Barnesiella sp.]